ncbi:hypothetical protein DPMN_162198 [Dreissena polymorpha]|uniref:Uncharacterized protein n=1 Tax=Dreissena polymorpha TaxID=45954 RepID=A0A9D4EUF7_DREPO|nr:hypothetical protein DPMN_162198 [Dreissena polymorpha]
MWTTSETNVLPGAGIEQGKHVNLVGGPHTGQVWFPPGTSDSHIPYITLVKRQGDLD